MEKVIEILKGIKGMAEEKNFVLRHRMGEKDFTRVKKIKFTDIIFFVLCQIKQSLDFDKEYFFGKLEINVCASAVTQRRNQVNNTAFEEILEYVSEKLPTEKRFKDYRIIAADGMTGELPRQPELIEQYGLVDSFYPKFHATAFYDVLNEIYVCADWSKYPTDEKAAAERLIKSKNIPDKSILLFDRGYPSVKLFHLLNTKNHKFMMRVSNKSTFKEVMEFSKSGEADKIVSINYDKKRANWNGHKLKDFDFDLPYIFELRCVKIPLDNGETEFLVTNLSSDEFSISDLKELYAMRWGIETSYNYLKNAVNLETFIGIKDNSIKQEFFAALTVFSLAKCAAQYAQFEYIKKNEIYEIPVQD